MINSTSSKSLEHQLPPVEIIDPPRVNDNDNQIISIKNFKIINIPADGDCFYRTFAMGMKESSNEKPINIDEVISLRNELANFYIDYSNGFSNHPAFAVNDASDILSLILTQGHWAGNAGDFVPIIAAQSTGRAIHIFQREDDENYRLVQEIPGYNSDLPGNNNEHRHGEIQHPILMLHDVTRQHYSLLREISDVEANPSLNQREISSDEGPSRLRATSPQEIESVPITNEAPSRLRPSSPLKVEFVPILSDAPTRLEPSSPLRTEDIQTSSISLLTSSGDLNKSSIELILEMLTTKLKADLVDAAANEGTTKLNPSKRSKINQILNKIDDLKINLRDSSNDGLNKNENAFLSLRLEELSKIMPKSDINDLLQMLSEIFKSAWERGAKESAINESYERNKALENPGSQFSTDTEYQLFLSTGSTPSVKMKEQSMGEQSMEEKESMMKKNEGWEATIGAGIFLQKSRSLEGNDENKISLITSKNLGLRLNAQARLHSTPLSLDGVIQVDHQRYKVNEFKNVKTYAKEHGFKEQVQSRKRDDLDRTNPLRGRLKHELINFESDQQKVISFERKFKNLMASELGIEIRDDLAPKPVRKAPKHGSGHATNLRLGGFVNLSSRHGLGLMGAVASISREYESIRFAQTMWNACGDSQNTPGKNLSQVNERRIQEVNQLTDKFTPGINSLFKPDSNASSSSPIVLETANRDQLLNALEQLEILFDDYSEIVRERDTQKSFHEKNPETRNQKKQLENAWMLEPEKGLLGLTEKRVGRIGFVKAAVVANTAIGLRLTQLDDFSSEDFKKINQVEKKLMNPNFEYDPEKLTLAVTFPLLKETSNKKFEVSGNINGTFNSTQGILTPCTIGIDYSVSTTEHPSRYKDGITHDVILHIGGGIDLSTFQSEALNSQLRTIDPSFDLQGVINETGIAALGNHTRMIQFSFFRPNFDVSKDTSHTSNSDPSLIPKTSHQFTRLLKNTAVSMEGAVAAPTGSGLTIGAGLNVTKQSEISTKEFFSTNTIIHALSRFIRLEKNGEIEGDDSKWSMYSRDNDKQFKKLIQAINDPASNVHDEVNYFLNEYEDLVNSSRAKHTIEDVYLLRESIFTTAHEYCSNPTPETFLEAKSAIDALFKAITFGSDEDFRSKMTPK